MKIDKRELEKPIIKKADGKFATLKQILEGPVRVAARLSPVDYKDLAVARFEKMDPQKVISVVDTSYTGEYGLEETVNRSEEALKEASVMKEKKLLGRFFDELGKDSGLAIYGVKEVAETLKSGSVEVLLISEHFDWVKARLCCPKCGEKAYVARSHIFLRQGDLSPADSLVVCFLICY